MGVVCRRYASALKKSQIYQILAFVFTCDGELLAGHDNLFLICSKQDFAPLFTSHFQPLTLSLYNIWSCKDKNLLGF